MSKTWKGDNFGFQVHLIDQKCKKRVSSFFNNVFLKDGSFSEDNWSFTEPKTEKTQQVDKLQFWTLFTFNLLENVKKTIFLYQ